MKRRKSIPQLFTSAILGASNSALGLVSDGVSALHSLAAEGFGGLTDHQAERVNEAELAAFLQSQEASLQQADFEPTDAALAFLQQHPVETTPQLVQAVEAKRVGVTRALRRQLHTFRAEAVQMATESSALLKSVNEKAAEIRTIRDDSSLVRERAQRLLESAENEAQLVLQQRESTASSDEEEENEAAQNCIDEIHAALFERNFAKAVTSLRTLKYLNTDRSKVSELRKRVKNVIVRQLLREFDLEIDQIHADSTIQVEDQETSVQTGSRDPACSSEDVLKHAASESGGNSDDAEVRKSTQFLRFLRRCGYSRLAANLAERRAERRLRASLVQVSSFASVLHQHVEEDASVVASVCLARALSETYFSALAREAQELVHVFAHDESDSDDESSSPSALTLIERISPSRACQITHWIQRRTNDFLPRLLPPQMDVPVHALGAVLGAVFAARKRHLWPLGIDDDCIVADQLRYTAVQVVDDDLLHPAFSCVNEDFASDTWVSTEVSLGKDTLRITRCTQTLCRELKRILNCLADIIAFPGFRAEQRLRERTEKPEEIDSLPHALCSALFSKSANRIHSLVYDEVLVRVVKTMQRQGTETSGSAADNGTLSNAQRARCVQLVSLFANVDAIAFDVIPRTQSQLESIFGAPAPLLEAAKDKAKGRFWPFSRGLYSGFFPRKPVGTCEE
ncbi:MAG: hypothetical protein MHM6MM_001970 [Cercozoa sp. M6MM]